jgi:hydrogenase maturation protease
MKRVLVAGVGNIFLGDDAFGVEVARRLSTGPIPSGVRVADFGIRSMHLAYEMADGRYDLTVLIDAASRGGAPGTVYVIEPDSSDNGEPVAANAHAISPDTVLATVRTLGASPGRVLIVGCEPASVEEGMELSSEVAGAVEEAVGLVRGLLEQECAEGECDVSGDSGANRGVASR